MPTVHVKRLNKKDLLAKLAELSGRPKTDVEAVLDAIRDLAEHELRPGMAGELVIPDLVKLKRVVRPAKAARPGRNPATGQPMTIAAKPESVTVKATLLAPFVQAVASK